MVCLSAWSSRVVVIFTVFFFRRTGIMSIGRFTPLWRLWVVALTGYGMRYDDDCLVSLFSFASFREWIACGIRMAEGES
jgi:hypothetical protein